MGSSAGSRALRRPSDAPLNKGLMRQLRERALSSSGGRAGINSTYKGAKIGMAKGVGQQQQNEELRRVRSEERLEGGTASEDTSFAYRYESLCFTPVRQEAFNSLGPETNSIYFYLVPSLPGAFETKLQESDLHPTVLLQFLAFSCGTRSASCRQSDVSHLSLSHEKTKHGRLWVLTMQNITLGTMGREAEAPMETHRVCSMVICNPSC